MAAPASTTRQTPAGKPLEEGHGITIAFSRDPDVEFWEVEVQPPGIEGGDKVTLTNQHNIRWRTFAPRKLYELSPSSFSCRYDPIYMTNVRSNLINQNAAITVKYPDGSKVDAFGFLKNFIPAGMAEGGEPVANGMIEWTNWDPVNDVEADPVYTGITGT